MTECDTLLMVGSGFPYAEFMPEEGQARGGPDRHRTGHAVVALSDGGQSRGRRGGDACVSCCRFSIRRTIGSGAARSRSKSLTGGSSWASGRCSRAKPVNPQRVVWELSSRLPDNAIVTSDSGSCANWYARDLKMRRGMMASLSGGLASMGAAVPYAIAAKFAHPDRPVVGLVGDGAMQMSNMAELITVAKYWREWADQPAGSCASSTTRISTR